MKKTILILTLFLISTITFSQSYEIKVKIKGVQDTVVYLCHHFGKQKYVVDTARVDSKGNACFSKKRTLPKGIYLVVMPSKGMNYFEILIANSQKFSVETDTSNYYNNMIIKGCEENIAFNKYQRKMIDLSQKINKLNNDYQTATKEQDTAKQREIREKMKACNNERTNYLETEISAHPKYFFSTILKSMIDIEVPEAPKNENGEAIDPNFAYHYFKKHFWDNVNFGESGLLRTPIYEAKLDYYVEKMIPPIPDSLMIDVNKIIRKAYDEGDTLMFQYTCSHLFNMFDSSRIMGFDAVMVSIAEEWYLSGKAHWADTAFLRKAAERVEKITPNKIGAISYNLLRMQSINDKYFNLHSIPANYTVIIFFEPSCGHCKKEVPKLRDLYKDTLKDMGVKIFTVYTQYDKPEWAEFIEKEKLDNIDGWFNVWDGPYPHSKFRDYYDIYSTPAIFILDKDKKIIAKRLGVDNIKEFILKYEEKLKYEAEQKLKN